MSTVQTLDIFIIGAGPIGLACGIEAKKRELSYCIADRGMLVNSLYRYPKNMTFFSTSEKLEIGGVPFVSHGHKPTRNEALEYYRRVAQKWELNLSLYNPLGSIEQKPDGSYHIQTQRGAYKAHSLIIATGFYDIPHQMDIPGEELDKVKHYYDEPHPFFGQKLLVVGASNSSVDAALECYRKGAEVTMAIRGSGIGERVKYWVKPDIENRIKEGSIQAFFHTKVKRIIPKAVLLERPEGSFWLKNDFVLALTGYEPDLEFLCQLGIQLRDNKARTPVYNPKTMETNRRNIFLAGVICGGLETHKWFIENSRVHAERAVEQIAQRLALVD